MKVAFVGNMNNMFFAITRYFRDRSITADLFLLNNEAPHFTPAADTYDLAYRDYTYQLSFGNPYWFLNEIKQIKEQGMSEIKKLKEYDVIFALGSAPAFLEYFNIKMDFFIPAGIDLYSFPFYIESANKKHRKHLDLFSQYQQKSIKNTEKVFSSQDILQIPSLKTAITQLSIEKKIKTFYSIPIIYENIYNKNTIQDNFNKSYWKHEFEKIRKKSKLVVFHHSRHVWKNNIDPNALKQNNFVIEGFAQIVQEHSSLNPQLILFDYGPDVADSKQLISKLGITNHVEWMPLMNRKDIMVGLYFCDIATGEFGHGWSMGGTIIESLIASKPLIHYIDKLAIDLRHLYPFLYAQDAKEIHEKINYFLNNKQKCDEIADRAYLWIKEYCINGPIESIIQDVYKLSGSKA